MIPPAKTADFKTFSQLSEKTGGFTSKVTHDIVIPMHNFGGAYNSKTVREIFALSHFLAVVSSTGIMRNKLSLSRKLNYLI